MLSFVIEIWKIFQCIIDIILPWLRQKKIHQTRVNQSQQEKHLTHVFSIQLDSVLFGNF